jgi:hypothetical protein
MVDVAEGLQIYAQIKNIIGLGILLIILIVAIIFCVNQMNQDYVLSTNAFISFSKMDNGNLVNCILGTPECNYYANYEVNGKMMTKPVTNIDAKNKPVLGKTTIYYSSNNPDNYTISSIYPVYIPSISMTIVLLLIGAIGVNIYLTYKYKSWGTVQGSLAAVSDISDIFRR